MVKNYKDIVIKKLENIKKEDIIFTDHAVLQASVRRLDPNEVKRNILKPNRLTFAEKQGAKNKNEEKYNCYFGYSKTQAHRYIIVIKKESGKVIILTVIKLNRRWQHKVEKRGKL